MKGIGASDGISIGKVYKYNQVEIVVDQKQITDIDGEKQRFAEAIRKSQSELEKIKQETSQKVDQETAAIFGAHIEIINDPELISGVNSMIAEDKVNADFAFQTVANTFIAMFESMDNDYFRERAADIKDVSKRILKNILGMESASLAEINQEVVLVAKDLTPSDTAQLDKKLVKAFVTDIGGRTSHSAIMARTLEIPAVVGTKNGFEQLEDGDIVIVNGFDGRVIIRPNEEELDQARQAIEQYHKNKQIWAQYKQKASQTKDGKRFEIGANIGNPEDLAAVLENGGECIGLYRTEFLYMEKSDYPTEQEQFEAYQKVLQGMNGKPVVVRTLDIGGDKELSYLPLDKEMNPFLGNRALRLCMNRPEMFKTQLRALLRAACYGNLHIMFPMIATLDEIKQAKHLLNQAKDELTQEGVEVAPYQVGIMIEIPAAAILADQFAKEVDFFSIGTNDLIQYSFAADRMNEKVSYLYQPFNPSLLRLIDMVIRAAHSQGKWVGMCGEMAGEMKALPLLIGLGLDEFSMSASSILQARYRMSEIDAPAAQKLAAEALNCADQQNVLELVEKFYQSI